MSKQVKHAAKMFTFGALCALTASTLAVYGVQRAEARYRLVNQETIAHAEYGRCHQMILGSYAELMQQLYPAAGE